MGKGRKPAPARLTAQLLPVLAKPLSAVGIFVVIQGRDWGGCPASDKDKWLKCIVRRIEAVHDFPGGGGWTGRESMGCSSTDARAQRPRA